jgi:BirA family biotin operon repressor/biotin-[acetyl-CoA-carboxylase] ligase
MIAAAPASASAAASAALPSGYRRVAFDRVASTNDEAKRYAEDGAGEGLVVTALEQTAGRGRQGKAWVSPPGNLFASLVLRPACPAARAAELVFAAGVAACDALTALLPTETKPRCKWPNDLMIKGRKVAGILAEAATDASGACDFVVLGIGINVAHHPPEAAWPATSLAAQGATTDVEATLAHLVASWDEWYRRWHGEGFVTIRAAWLERAFALGQTIELKQDRGARQGRFLGLDASGALVIETVTGKRETHHFGDVIAARE